MLDLDIFSKVKKKKIAQKIHENVEVDKKSAYVIYE
jgi:hypothetical protein